MPKDPKGQNRPARRYVPFPLVIDFPLVIVFFSFKEPLFNVPEGAEIRASLHSSKRGSQWPGASQVDLVCIVSTISRYAQSADWHPRLDAVGSLWRRLWPWWEPAAATSPMLGVSSAHDGR